MEAGESCRVDCEQEGGVEGAEERRRDTGVGAVYSAQSEIERAVREATARSPSKLTTSITVLTALVLHL